MIFEFKEQETVMAKELKAGDLFIMQSDPNALRMRVNRTNTVYTGNDHGIPHVVIAFKQPTAINSLGQIYSLRDEAPVYHVEIVAGAVQVKVTPA